MWKSWTKSLSCRKEEHVHNPVAISAGPNRAPRSAGCAKSLSSLKDVIHGNTLSVKPVIQEQHRQQQQQRRGHHPMSDSRVWCSENSNRLLKQQEKAGSRGRHFVAGGCHGCNVADEALGAIIFHRDYSRSLCRFPHPTCQRCGESFSKYESLEHHLVAKHAVTELGRGDSSRNIVEIIFRTSWLKKEGAAAAGVKIERILKINNTQRTVARFEEYRESVKIRASALQKKHARCIADGNELLRFHACALRCNLGWSGSSATCSSSGCTACRVIKSGFRTSGGTAGGLIHTAATSGKAHDLVVRADDQVGECEELRAMLMCRVIAGRMHKGFPAAAAAAAAAAAVSVQDHHEGVMVPSGFDSIAGDLGPFSNVDDLYVHSSRAVLPCFVVIYRW